MQKVITILLISLVTICCSCDSVKMLDQSIPTDDDQYANHFFALLKYNNIDSARSLLSNDYPEQQYSQLKIISEHLSGSEVKSMKHIGYSVLRYRDIERSSITYEFEFEDKWAVIGLTIEEVNNHKSITYVFLDPLSRSVEEMNAFTLDGKGRLPKFFLVVSILVLLTTLIALYLCMRSSVRKKMVWILFIITGVGKVDINWSYETITFQVISIQLFSSGILKMGPYAPWVLSISLPLGAMIFLIKYYRQKEIEASEINPQPL